MTEVKYYLNLIGIFGQEVGRCVVDKNEEFKQIVQFFINQSKICSTPTVKAAEYVKDAVFDALLDSCYEVLDVLQVKKEICQQENENEGCVQAQLQPLYNEVEKLENVYDYLKDYILQIRESYMLCEARYKDSSKPDSVLDFFDTFVECIKAYQPGKIHIETDSREIIFNGSSNKTQGSVIYDLFQNIKLTIMMF